MIPGKLVTHVVNGIECNLRTVSVYTHGMEEIVALFPQLANIVGDVGRQVGVYLMTGRAKLILE